MWRPQSFSHSIVVCGLLRAYSLEIYRVVLARTLRAAILLYKKAANLHATKIWGTPLEELQQIYADIEVKKPIANRVKVSFALRECATLVDSSSSTFEQVLAMVRFLPYTSDESSVVNKMKPILISCELEPATRITLFKEIFVKVYVGKRLKDDAAINKKRLVDELDSIQDFVDRATEQPILDEMFNDTLADFVQSMNAPRLAHVELFWFVIVIDCIL